MSNVNRRDFLKLSGTTLIGMTLGSTALRAHAQETLSPDDPTAKALQYVEKSAKEGSKCGNCMYAQGDLTGKTVGCGIFPGKVVNAEGWCSAWAKRP